MRVVVQVVLFHGEVGGLAGIYSIAFLGVMASFTIGTMMLVSRASRGSTASGSTAAALTATTEPPAVEPMPQWQLALALSLVLVALLGTFLGKGSVLLAFLAYFLSIYALCLACLYGDRWWAPSSKGAEAGSSAASQGGAMELVLTASQDGGCRATRGD